MPLGMIEVDDLGSPGELLVGDVPDPEGAVAQDCATLGLVEAAPARLAIHALGELRYFFVAVAAGGALDRRRVTDSC